ncbi:MAG: DNA repair protein RecO [Candidatus Portnoybacteria bacterium]|nr:DNA repair protein RecO [Candidatus Portnoybacteria bacterium]
MIKTEGIILKKSDLGEADRLLTIYTKELGKVRISAKGTRKTTSKLRYSIEPISHVSLILVQGKNFLILKDAVLENQFLNIKKDLEKLKIANEIMSIIDEAIAGEEKDEDIWELMLITLRGINQNKLSLKTIISDFKNNLIKLLGYDPEEIKEIQDIY